MGVRGYLDDVAPVYWVVLDRPEKLNALDEGMWRGLAARVSEGCGGVAALVALRGEGRAFCTGDDIGAMHALESTGEATRFYSALAGAVEAIASCPKPVAALVHGYAYGGCLEMLLLVDYVVAVRGARFAAPEVRLGLIPPLLASLGPVLLGRRAAWMAMTGREFTAEEALVYGVVDEIVNSIEEGVKAVRRLAEAAAHAASQALAETRRLMLKTLESAPFREALDVLARLTLTHEAKERMAAFLSRRRKGGPTASG